MRLIKEDEIDSIYRDHIMINNNHDYLTRYKDLPLDKNNKKWKWEGKDFPRIISLLEIERYINKYNINSKHILSFNNISDPEMEYLKYDRITNFNYEENKTDYDLHTLNIPQSDYDFSMFNQTLEHLYNPFVCLDNIYKYLSVGSYTYCNVPTVNIQHSLPNNFYTGFTPIGLAVLFKSCGFKIVEVGQWGTYEYISKIFKSHNWPDYQELSGYVNEFKNPAQTWILAKKI